MPSTAIAEHDTQLNRLGAASQSRHIACVAAGTGAWSGGARGGRRDSMAVGSLSLLAVGSLSRCRAGRRNRPVACFRLADAPMQHTTRRIRQKMPACFTTPAAQSHDKVNHWCWLVTPHTTRASTVFPPGTSKSRVRSEAVKASRAVQCSAVPGPWGLFTHPVALATLPARGRLLPCSQPQPHMTHTREGMSARRQQ